MTGHIRLDKATNRYQYIIEVGAKGERKRKVKRGFKKKSDAMNAMALAIAELQQKEEDSEPNSITTLEEFFSYWLQSYAKSSTSPNTYKGYERIIRVHLQPILGNVNIEELKTRQIQDYYTLKLKSLSAQTVKHHHRLLCKALNDAVDWEFVSKNVALKAKAPKPDKFRPTTYTEKELKQLFEAAKRSGVYFPIIFSAGHTGARLGELRALQWSDIDFENRKIYITKTAYDDNEGVKIKDLTKNGHDRYVVMGKRLLTFLKEHHETFTKIKEDLGKSFNPRYLVFYNANGDFINPRELTRAYKNAIKRAKLPNARFHDLRHSHATILLSKNVHPKIVSDRLGHTKISTTIDLYSHVNPSLQEGAIQIFDEVFDE